MIDFVEWQKQPLNYKKGVLENFSKFTGKNLRKSLFSSKVVGLSYRQL